MHSHSRLCPTFASLTGDSFSIPKFILQSLRNLEMNPCLSCSNCFFCALGLFGGRSGFRCHRRSRILEVWEDLGTRRRV